LLRKCMWLRMQICSHTMLQFFYSTS